MSKLQYNMSLFIPIHHFPEEWSRRARCPVCKHGSMVINHNESLADHMHCLYCGVSFEVEEKGEHLFFIDTPINMEDELKNRWVTRQQLQKALENKRIEATQHQVEFSPIKNTPKANPLRADAVKRARTLVELGNSADVIRQSLSDSLNLTDFAIEEIITDAFNVHKMKLKKRFLKISLIAAGIITISAGIFFFLYIIL